MEMHRFIVSELSSAGFGSPGDLMQTRADLIMDSYDYLRFKNKYESQYYLRSKRT
jgi:hypothetical protein